MSVVQTTEGQREVTRDGAGGIVFGGHGVLGVEVWVLSTQAASDLVGMLEPLSNATEPTSLGSVPMLTSVGRRPLQVVLRSAVLELRDERKLQIIRWNLRRQDQIDGLRSALEAELAEEITPASELDEVEVPTDSELAELRRGAESGVLPTATVPVDARMRR
jgi:hypothetical protein